MKITYDEDVDVMYINLSDAEIKEKVEYTKSREDFFIDFNEEDSIIGIEILNASSIINKMHKKVN